MADQDQSATEPTEVPAEVTDTDLEKVVGGSLPIGGVAGESTDDKHKDHRIG
jgi:hypothetical protein